MDLGEREQTYSPLTSRVRIGAAAIAVVASTLVLGGALSLFEMRANEAAAQLAKAKASPATNVVAERTARAARRS